MPCRQIRNVAWDLKPPMATPGDSRTFKVGRDAPRLEGTTRRPQQCSILAATPLLIIGNFVDIHSTLPLPLFYTLYFRTDCKLSRTCKLLVSNSSCKSGLCDLTSSSIFASAMSCSLPLPLATFCASEIWALTASALKSSSA